MLVFALALLICTATTPSSDATTTTPPPKSSKKTTTTPPPPPLTTANPKTPAAAADVPLAPLSPAAPLVAAKPPPPAESPDKHGVVLGLSVGALVPSGRPASTFSDAGASQPFGKRSVTVPISLEVLYRLPLPAPVGRDLSLFGEVGWYPLSGGGSRALPQDPDFGALGYSWSATHIPLQIGVDYRLPLHFEQAMLAPLTFNIDASFAAVWSKYGSTYTAENVADAPQSGWALGFGLGAGAGYRVGPGDITFEARWLNARTDLQLQAVYPGQPYNAKLGDVQGANYLLGYRIAL